MTSPRTCAAQHSARALPYFLRPCALVLSLALLLGAALAQSVPVQPPPVTPPAQTAPATDAPPLSLTDALAAGTASAQSRQAQLALQVAQAQLQAAQASTGFTAGINSSLSTDLGATSGLAGSVGATLSLPLLPWSSANLAAQSAARAYAAAQATFAQATLTLNTTLEGAYGRAVTAELNLGVVQAQAQLAGRQLSQTQAFYADNNATLPALQSAQAAVQDAQTALLRAQAERTSARRALGTLVGRDLSDVALNPDLSGPPLLASQDAALAAARRFSPALLDAQNAVQSAQAALDAARRARDLPAATLSTSLASGSGTSRSGLTAGLNLSSGVASAGYSLPFTLGGSSASTGSSGGTATTTSAAGTGLSFALALSASFNLLDPAADGALKVAGLQLQAAQAALTVQRQALDQGLLDAYSAAQIAAQAVPARQTSVQSDVTALATARTRLTLGLATQSEVLGAEIALAQAQLALTQAQLSALTTAAQLAALTGPAPGP